MSSLVDEIRAQLIEAIKNNRIVLPTLPEVALRIRDAAEDPRSDIASFARELGFDAAINYKTDDVGAAIRAACPNGVDVFFDNVGGEILEAAIANIALRGRIVLCGAIAQYNDEVPRPGPANLSLLISMRGRMEGFIILDYMSRANEAIGELAGWVMGGELKFAVDVVDGLDNAPVAMDRLFTGANQGKVMVRL